MGARRSVVLSVLAVATLIGAACTPGGTTGSRTAAPTPSATGVIGTEPVTLTVWDQETGRVSKIWDRLNAEFMEKYPNVTIERVRKSFSDLKTSLKLAVAGPNPPDVVEANQGWPDMGALVRAGLLLPLDGYAEAYGWLDRVPAGVLAVNRFTPDASEFGTGSLYGFTGMGEMIGVFYNKTKLAQLGLERPATFAEFEHALEVAKQAGEVPIAFGNLDKFAGIHEFTAIQNVIAPKDYLTDLIFSRRGPDLSFDTPENREAAAILREWAEKGYFTEGFNGVGYDDVVARFVEGEGVFMITGNWIVQNIGPENRDFGFFVMPPLEAGDPPVTTGGPGFPLAIAAASEHPDVAAAYIDWMTSDHAGQMLIPTGQLPLYIGADTSGIDPESVLGELLAEADRVSRADGLVPYLDWATPTFYDTTTAAIQELMGLKIGVEEFVRDIDADYAAFQASRG